MILRFPNPETFRLAATSSLLPRAVAISELDFSEVPNAECFARFEGKLDKTALNELGLLGVKAAKDIPGEVQKYSCWLQAIPAVRDPHPPTLAANAPVLFELPDADELTGIVSEMLRLGNDRQGFRWISNPADSSQRRVLLRVVGPPYYTLLRALDRLVVGESDPVRAFAEAAPRVWVELGFSHPAAARIQLPEDQLLLMRAPRDWTYLPEVPFQDIYEILQFQLPQPVRSWQAREFPDSIPVPLKLLPGHSTESPEMWILRGEAGMNELNRFVQNCDERTAQRLKFAIADRPDGERVAVVRASALRSGGPILELSGALAYKPHPSLSNLFLPIGMRLHPTLRRDALRELMAEDPDQIVWLVPGSEGAFAPESVLDSAFVPLEEWVDYIVEQAHEPLRAWVESSRFDFDSFICSDEKGPKPRDPGAGPKKPNDGETKAVEPPRDSTASLTVRDDAVPVRGSSSAVVLSAELAPNEWKARRDELQKQFLSIPGPLDAPDRAALWLQLAEANAGAGDLSEAALCWTHALWLQESPDSELLSSWSRAERGNSNKITAPEFDFHLENTEPVKGEARLFSAMLCQLGYSTIRPEWFASRLPRIQKYLEIQEPKLPVRVVWLVARCLAKLSGADTLGLARIRDRLLQRLLEGGLNPELDLPFFLRTAGLNDSERVRQVRDRAEEIYKAVRKWVEVGTKPTTSIKGKSDPNPSVGYVDLLFAFGLAKLGESQAAAKLRAAGRAILEQAPADKPCGIAGRFLFRVFDFRIEQALAGKALSGRLPVEMHDEIFEMQKRFRGVPNHPETLAHFAIARMCQFSKILEPSDRLDALASNGIDQAEEYRKVAYQLSSIHEPTLLARRIREVFFKTDSLKLSPIELSTRQFLLLNELLPLAARCGPDLSYELVRLAPAMLKTSYSMVELNRKHGQLLERSLFLSGHFDFRDLVAQLAEALSFALSRRSDEDKYAFTNEFVASGLLSLRKLGLKDEAESLLLDLQKSILGSGGITDLKLRWAARPVVFIRALRTLVAIAKGFLVYGKNDFTKSVLDSAKSELIAIPLNGDMPIEYEKLLTAYISALSQMPTDSAISAIVDIFEKLNPKRITNHQSTAFAFSLLHLIPAHEVVLAVVSDDFVLGASGRRWLEDDEYLVRQRIHADLRRSLAKKPMSLLFPSPDALRLALAGGAIPWELARQPVRAALGERGELWLGPSETLGRDLLAALARFGVRQQTPPVGLEPEEFPCWAGPIPLRPSTTENTTAVLIGLPRSRLAPFFATIQRTCPQLSFDFQFENEMVWIRFAESPPEFLLDSEANSVYRAAGPSLWIRSGWEHPAIGELAIQPGVFARLDAPNRWTLSSEPAFRSLRTAFLLAPPAVKFPGANPLRGRHSIPLKLRKCANSDRAETLWRVDGSAELLRETLAALDVRFLRKLELAQCEKGYLLRYPTRSRPPVLPAPFRGFVECETRPGCFLPPGREWNPQLRSEVLGRALGHSVKALMWVEESEGNLHFHQVEFATFHSVESLLQPVAPSAMRLKPLVRIPSLLDQFAPFEIEAGIEVVQLPSEPIAPIRLPRAVSPPASKGWFEKITGRIFPKSGKPKPKPKREKDQRRGDSESTLQQRMPQEWEARRLQLESDIAEGQAEAPATVRWCRWTELARVAGEGQKPSETALCWINSLWERETPPAEWCGEWMHWERLNARAETALECNPAGGIAQARLACAELTAFGCSSESTTDADGISKRLALIEAREGQLPIRAVWLANVSSARLLGGDALGLARARDRLLARLAHDGPAIDLDAPTFLRFHGGIDGDRFRAVREWLVHVRDPIQKWIGKMATGQRLDWAGLDPDPRATGAYADAMLAWGLSRVGERGKAQELLERSGNILRRIAGPGADPAVHRELWERFRERIESAQLGRTTRPDTSSNTPLVDYRAEYSRTKLPAHSTILASANALLPFGELELADFLGSDDLGERLRSFRKRPLAEAARELWRRAKLDPTAETLPRTALILAENPAELDGATAMEIVGALPRAIDLLPESLRRTAPGEGDRRPAILRWSRRGLESALRSIFTLNGGESLETLSTALLESHRNGDGIWPALLPKHSGAIYAAFRKMGRMDLIGTWLAELGESPAGLFALGREDRAWKSLDEDREELFVRGIQDMKARTKAAFDYVEALSLAPPRLALGRLEELFQRLDRISTDGATAQYYALKPLELIDRAISVAVTDEFGLGPKVRRWLDDDEFLIRQRIGRDALAAVG